MKKLIYATILLSIVCMVAINANLPAFAGLNGISSKTTGLIVSMNPLMCLFFSVPFAYLSDKYNRFVIIFIGLFFYFIAATTLVFFQSIPALFIVKSLEGLANAAYLPAVTAFIADISEEENLSKNMGSFTSVLNIGFLIAPAISGVLGSFFGLHAIFIFTLVCSVINLVLCIPIYRIFKQESFSVEKEIIDVKELKKSDLSKFFWPVIISISLLSFAFGYSFGLYDTVWAYYILDLGGNVFLVNMTWFCYALPVVLLSQFMGTLADKYKNLHLPIMIGSIMISVAVISYGMIPFPVIILFICALEGVGNSAVYPCINAALVKSVDKYFKGRVMGIFNTARTAGNFVGAIVTGYIFAFMTLLPFIINSLLIFTTSMIATFFVFKYRKESRVINSNNRNNNSVQIAE